MSAIHVDLLTKAREIVARPKFDGGICDALNLATDAAVQDVGPKLRARSELKSHIQTELWLVGNGYLSCLEAWLIVNHGVSPRALRKGLCDETLKADWADVKHHAQTKKLIATRLAWIDWLIEEWRDAP